MKKKVLPQIKDWQSLNDYLLAMEKRFLKMFVTKDDLKNEIKNSENRIEKAFDYKLDYRLDMLFDKLDTKNREYRDQLMTKFDAFSPQPSSIQMS